MRAGVTRAPLLLFLLLILTAAIGPADARANDKRRHAISLVRPPELPPDFKHFPYADPDAPKGGKLRLGYPDSFDNLNPFTFKGNLAPGLDLNTLAQFLHEPLMTRSYDEASTLYGLVAEWVSHPEDFSSVTFGLRAGARFHDDRPITPEDVIYSMAVQKKANPSAAFYYQDVLDGEKTGEREVTFRFKTKGNRELPMIVAEMHVMPRHWWTGRNAAGEPRDPEKTTSEPPLGSGPYRIKSVDMGRGIVFERVKDHWAQDLPVRRGQYNFDEISFTAFTDTTPLFEAFKSGLLDIRSEGHPKRWMVEYDFPAVRDGRVRKETFRLDRSAAHAAFVANLRRKAFGDRRVRQALWFALDFESYNTQVSYGTLKRVSSVFEGTELASSGLPGANELKLLEPLRAKLPPEVFTKTFTNPVNATPMDLRKHLKEADRLLTEAGFVVKNGTRMLPGGTEPFSIEMLAAEKLQERYLLPWQSNLKLLGIQSRTRMVDGAQYEQRTRAGDFDVIVHTISQSESPGNEQREFWGSAAADRMASRNRAGIKDPAIDALVEAIVYAKSRQELVAASRALDRALLWNFYIIPRWYLADTWIASWNRFGRPERHPKRAISFWQTWWQTEAPKQ